jgi:hypothetical protein
MRLFPVLLMSLASAVASAEPPPAELAPAVALAEARGAELFALDRAAWVATDDLHDRFGASKLKGVSGWIVSSGAETMSVIWIGGSGAEARAYFETDVPRATLKAQATRQLETPRALSALEARMWQARALAIAQPFEACRSGYNTTVVPVGVDGSDGFDVYLLAPQMTPSEVVLGKHYLLRVDAAAGSVVQRREFSRTCIAGTMPKNAVSWGGTHLLDPTPTEIHVLVSLQVGKDLSIVTTQNGLMWGVAAGKVSFAGSLKR